nr:FadR family transcriptional regulator [Pseudomonas sp.]
MDLESGGFSATSFEKIRKVPAYRQVAEAITRQILEGVLREGNQLPTEAKLCETFGVNRSTVREAVRVLEEAHLLRRESAKRLLISRPTPDELGTQFHRAFILYEVHFEELWEAISVIDPAIARLAAERRDEEQLARLDENLAATEAALEEGSSVAALNMAFGQIVADMSGNRALKLARASFSRTLLPFLHPIIFSRIPVAGERMLQAHQEVARALRQGDAEQAAHWTLKHIVDFRRGYQIATQPAAPRAAETE